MQGSRLGPGSVHQDVASGKSVNGRPGLDVALTAVRRHEVDEGWTLVLLDVGRAVPR